MLSNGDIEAAYREMRDSLLAIARRSVHCDTDAEDVLHAAFRRFFERGPRTLTREEARRYLARCTVNAAADWWRSERSRVRCQDARVHDDPPPNPDEPTGRLLHDERITAVQRALADLPERQRDAIALRYLAGRSTEEVAGIMCCETSTVRSLVRHGFRQLRHSLDHMKIGEER